MTELEIEKAKNAILRRHPNLATLVDDLMKSEDAELLLKRFAKMDSDQESECPSDNV